MQTSTGNRARLTVSRRLAGLALLACPSDYRREYGAQILDDLNESAHPGYRAAFEIVESGLQMHVDGIIRDISFAFRRLRSSPLFVLIVLLTFALGIGANVAVFSVINAVLLQPLPYANPQRLVAISIYDGRTKTGGGALSVPDLADLRAQSTLLQDLGVETPSEGTITGNGRPHTIGGLDVTPPYLQALGIRPQIGRVFTSSDERKGVRSIIISDSLWRQRFYGDVRVLGKHLSIDGVPRTIVGVALPGAKIPEISSAQLRSFDFLGVQPDTAPQNQRGARYLSGIALLRPGVTVEEANAELLLVSQRLQKRFPIADAVQTFKADNLRHILLGDVSPALWTVFIAVFGILLITCANVANLILANASNRDREFALRCALGASDTRIVRQLLVETGILAVAGGVIGVALAHWGLQFMIGAHLLSLPRINDVKLDAPVLLYALFSVAFSTIAAGFWPVFAVRKQNLSLTLKSAGRGGDASRSNHLRSGLVVAEVALALALVVVSGLMTRSFIALTHTDLGIRTTDLVTSDIAVLPSSRYGTMAPRALFARRLLSAIRSIPGVTSAATAISYPLSDVNVSFTIDIVGQSFPPGQQPTFTFNSVSSNYFSTLGIPVVRGREFTDADALTSSPVAVVNEALVHQSFPDGNALGKQIRTPGWNGSPRATRTIVGVVGNERHRLARLPRAEFYAPVSQVAPDMLSAVVRADGVNASAIGKGIQAAYAAADPLLEPPKTYTMGDLIDDDSLQPRSAASLLGTLAFVALLLALSGIFGVVSFSVSRRSREFGLRMALGAHAAHVLMDVLRRALMLTGCGVLIGIGLAAVAGRAISAQLNGVSAFDPLTFVTVIAAIVLCAALAAIIPAIRATRVDPAVALRYE